VNISSDVFAAVQKLWGFKFAVESDLVLWKNAFPIDWISSSDDYSDNDFISLWGRNRRVNDSDTKISESNGFFHLENVGEI
jgi:hypothetical protein